MEQKYKFANKKLSEFEFGQNWFNRKHLHPWKLQLLHLVYNTVQAEYYEIVGELRPLSGFFPTHADFFTEMHF